MFTFFVTALLLLMMMMMMIMLIMMMVVVVLMMMMLFTLFVTAPLLSMSTRLKICRISSSVTCHHHHNHLPNNLLPSLLFQLCKTKLSNEINWQTFNRLFFLAKLSFSFHYFCQKVDILKPER